MYNNDSKTEKSEGMSNEGFFAIMVMLFVFAITLNWDKFAKKLEAVYFHNFEEIYLTLYAALVIFAGFGIYLIKKKTKDLRERAVMLSSLWSKHQENILAGKTDDEISLHLTDKARCSHVQVIGTTGSGKTESVVKPWTLRDLNRGNSVVIIDGKGSMSLKEELSEELDFLKSKGEFFHFDLGDPANSIQINPLAHGSPQQVTDRIFTSFEFDDPFYKAVQYDLCGYLVRLLFKIDESVTFKALYGLLTDDDTLKDKLKLLAKFSNDTELLIKLKNHLKESEKDRKAKMAGLISQLSPFANSEIARIVNGSDTEVNLSNAILGSDTKLMLFSIPTLKYPSIGPALGKLLLQELAWSVGKKESELASKFTSVFLDEFSEFVYEGFVSILNKARSAKVALHLCHQSISDLTKVSESFARSINTNTNVKCIMGLNDPETADFYARHFGTKSEEKFTEAVEDESFIHGRVETGRGSKRVVETYKVHPNVLKNLYNGRGVLHLPTDRGVVTEVIQFSPFDKAENYVC